MQIIRLVRTIGACQEEYGRILFDGGKTRFYGLTCVFQKYLEKGISGSDNIKYKPADGIKFFDNLKQYLSKDVLMAADVIES